jgi:hypothetical protein
VDGQEKGLRLPETGGYSPDCELTVLGQRHVTADSGSYSVGAESRVQVPVLVYRKSSLPELAATKTRIFAVAL